MAVSFPLVITVERRVEASPEEAFDAWLDPEAAAAWLFATPGGVMRRAEIDARVGGRWRFDEERGDQLAEHFGEYLEIDRPRRLVFTFGVDPNEPPSRVTVEIAPDGGGARLTLTHEIDAKWADYVDRARTGWATILDGLAARLASASGA